MRMETSSSSSSGEITIECNGSSSECRESAETLSVTTDESLPDYGLPEMVVFLQDFKDIDIDTDVQSEDKFSLDIQDFDPEIITVLRPSDLGVTNEQSGRSTFGMDYHSNDKKDQIVEETTMATSAVSSVPKKIFKPNSELHKGGRRVCSLRELMLESPAVLSRESSTRSDDTSSVHPTACRGPNACPRSVSIRSNCSTTSFQSFAFPVLPRMWIGSPVRMAEPDRNHMWKHQGWRRYFRCFIV